MAAAPANALNIRRPPVFATVAEERLHRKRMLAAASRRMVPVSATARAYYPGRA
jgi:hypothetical protein